MSDIIKDARKALEGTTPSKAPNVWRVEKRYSFITYRDTWQVLWDVPNSASVCLVADTGGDTYSDEKDARFIAWAREGVTALIARAEAAEAALARAYMAGLDDAICEIDCGGCYGNCADPANCRQNDVRDIRALPVPADLAKRLGVSHE